MSDWHEAERRVERAQEFFEQHKWREALEELRAATTINPYNASWFVSIGLILDEMGRFDEAADVFRRAARIDPNDLRALDHLGQDLHRLGRFEQALRVFEQMEQIDPAYEPSYCHRIITYAELNDHQKAEEMFYTARLYKEHCPRCYYQMGISLEARALHDKAIYCWTRTLDLEGADPDVHVRIAEAFWRKGDLEQARQHYLADLREHPGRTRSLLDLGDLLLEMGRTGEAGEKFRRAIELDPGDPAGYYRHGKWLLRADADADALAAFSRALQLDPTFPGAHLYLGRLAHRRHDRNTARAHLRAELMLRPEDPRLMLDLANLLMDTDDTRAAIACLKRLTQLQPDNLSAWQNLAVAQFMRKHHSEGIASCQQVLARDAKNLDALHNLALAFEDLGKFDKALAHVRRALVHHPHEGALQRLELRLRFLHLRDKCAAALRAFFSRSRAL
jgi:tetratricopeptide (TPR) repeat protein